MQIVVRTRWKTFTMDSEDSDAIVKLIHDEFFPITARGRLIHMLKIHGEDLDAIINACVHQFDPETGDEREITEEEEDDFAVFDLLKSFKDYIPLSTLMVYLDKACQMLEDEFEELEEWAVRYCEENP
jgi:hypothetical protein